MILITSFYISNHNSNLNYERNNELKESLNKNLESEHIEEIHLFIDQENALEYIRSLNNTKIYVVNTDHQPLYSDFFDYCMKNLQNKICMISNSDIYLSSLDEKILKYLDDNNTVFALTRYEYDMSCPLIKKYMGSHDCFIFKAPLNSEFVNKVNHIQNVWGSENVVLYELHKIGVRLFNPCFQIITVHLHKSELRDENRIRINGSRSCSVRPSHL